METADSTLDVPTEAWAAVARLATEVAVHAQALADEGRGSRGYEFQYIWNTRSLRRTRLFSTKVPLKLIWWCFPGCGVARIEDRRVMGVDGES